jgi:hypothetical protein
VRIISKSLSEMTGHELKQCRSLTLRKGGLMCEDLTHWLHYEKTDGRMRRKCRIFMLKPDDSDKLIAWAFLMPSFKPTPGYDAQFYTRVSERGKGYASVLMEECTKVYPKPYVYPHDRTSGKFFAKHVETIRFDRDDREWL